MAAQDSKLTILALHGYIQNRTLMTSAMKKLFSGKHCSNFTWIIPEGPFVVSNETDSSETDRKRGWWELPSKDIFCKPHEYRAVEKAIQTVKNELNGREPDIIIGFSQGAVLATILLPDYQTNCKLAILMSGSDVQDSRFKPVEPIKTQTIMMVGVKDTLCTIDHTQELAKHFKTHEFVEHKWGHVIPSSAAVRDELLKYIRV